MKRRLKLIEGYMLEVWTQELLTKTSMKKRKISIRNIPSQTFPPWTSSSSPRRLCPR